MLIRGFYDHDLGRRRRKSVALVCEQENEQREIFFFLPLLSFGNRQKQSKNLHTIPKSKYGNKKKLKS